MILRKWDRRHLGLQNRIFSLWLGLSLWWVVLGPCGVRLVIHFEINDVEFAEQSVARRTSDSKS